MKKALIVAVAVIAITMGSVAGIALAKGLKAKPFEFEGDVVACGVDAAWVTHQGLPDAGNSDHALYLTKPCLTATIAASGAAIDGVQGTVLTGVGDELGFDVRMDGHCGAGARGSTCTIPMVTFIS